MYASTTGSRLASPTDEASITQDDEYTDWNALDRFAARMTSEIRTAA